MYSYSRYLRTRHKICIAYKGVISEFGLQLLFFEEAIKSKFSNFEVDIALCDKLEHLKWFKEFKLTKSIERSDYGCNIEVLYRPKEGNPVEYFLNENDINLNSFKESNINNKIIYITPERPVKLPKLSGHRLVDTLDEAEVVAGLESYAVYEAGLRGKIPAIPYGSLGKNIFQMMFPKHALLHT